MSSPSTIPEALRKKRQWVCWRYQERKGKQTKVPIDPTGQGVRFAKADDPRTWGSFAQAAAFAKVHNLDGLGFVFAADGDVFGIDVDHCIDDAGNLSDLAQRVLDIVPTTYVERSPSGRGLHVIGRCDTQIRGRNRRDMGLEVYTRERFFTVTGDVFLPERTAVAHVPEAFDAFLSEFFPDPAPTQDVPPALPAPAPVVGLDDKALVEKAMAAANGREFSLLWTGDISGHESHSEADLAMCNALAFWAGRDAERMDRLFRQSGLFRPEKWDRHAGHRRTYGAATISKAISGCREVYAARTQTKEPCPASPEKQVSDLPEGFSRQKSGIVYAETSKNPEGEPEVEYRFLCSNFAARAMTRNRDGESWGLVLEIPDPDGEVHPYIMPKAALAGDGTVYREEMLSRGLDIASGRTARAKLHELLTRIRPSERARCVSRAGWHDRRFVLPDGTAYGDGVERILLQPTPRDHAFAVAGTLADWQNAVGRFAPGNTLLTLALCCGPAAVLGHVLQVEGGGFHLFGRSSTGKTTALRAAGSFCGGGGLTGFIRSWRTTDNALEAVAASHCDNLLCLDEVGQAAPETVAATIYMLGNQAGKSRAKRDGSGRKTQEWRVLWLSSGEVEIAAKVQEKSRHHAGQEVRAIDLEFTGFQDLHGFSTARELADHLKRAAARFYGAPLRAFLEKLTADLDGFRELGEGDVTAFVKRMTPVDADGQVGRVAARFGLLAAAGELATKMGIMPWEQGAATRAAEDAFEDWLTARGGSMPAEVRDGVAAVRAFIQAHGQSRFQKWGETPTGNGVVEERAIINRCGFRRPGQADGIADYLVFASAFKGEVLKGLDVKSVCAALDKRGLLMRGDRDHWTIRHRVPGEGLTTFYHVRGGILDE